MMVSLFGVASTTEVCCRGWVPGGLRHGAEGMVGIRWKLRASLLTDWKLDPDLVPGHCNNPDDSAGLDHSDHSLNS